LAWTVEFSSGARKDLRRLDPQVARRVTAFLRERIATDEDPRRIGTSLEGSRLGEFWKYRSGDWRMICRIEDARVLVLVLRVGHRSEVYKVK
jgi:mRNA interferase RelE/StbE